MGKISMNMHVLIIIRSLRWSVSKQECFQQFCIRKEWKFFITVVVWFYGFNGTISQVQYSICKNPYTTKMLISWLYIIFLWESKRTTLREWHIWDDLLQIQWKLGNTNDTIVVYNDGLWTLFAIAPSLSQIRLAQTCPEGEFPFPNLLPRIPFSWKNYDVTSWKPRNPLRHSRNPPSPESSSPSRAPSSPRPPPRALVRVFPGSFIIIIIIIGSIPRRVFQYLFTNDTFDRLINVYKNNYKRNL